MALQRADPALLRDDDGDRLVLDHRLLDVARDRRRAHRRRWCGAGRARGSARAEIASSPRGSPRRSSSTACRRRRAAPRSRAFSSVSSSSSLRISNLFQLAQGAQAHVEDRLGLDVGERQARHQHRLRLVLLADDADHLVEVEIGDQQAAEDFQPPVDLRPAGSASGAAAPRGDGRAIPAAPRSATCTRGTRPRRQHVHVERDAAFELGQLEQRFHQQRRDRRCGSSAPARRGCPRPIRRGRRRAAAACARSAARRSSRSAATSAPVGDFGDDDLPGAAAEILDCPAARTRKPPRPVS